MDLLRLLKDGGFNIETKAITNGILAKHTGKTVEEIDEATAFDNFMNAKQAVEFGICDVDKECDIRV